MKADRDALIQELDDADEALLGAQQRVKAAKDALAVYFGVKTVEDTGVVTLKGVPVDEDQDDDATVEQRIEGVLKAADGALHYSEIAKQADCSITYSFAMLARLADKKKAARRGNGFWVHWKKRATAGTATNGHNAVI